MMLLLIYINKKWPIHPSNYNHIKCDLKKKEKKQGCKKNDQNIPAKPKKWSKYFLSLKRDQDAL